MSTILFRGVSKVYGNTRAVDNVDLTIEPGKIYGLLGRNGAGKTTLLNLLTNRIFSTAGEITLDGQPVLESDEALGRMFYMTEENLYPPRFTVKETFGWSEAFYPSFDMPYALELAKKFGLNVNKRVKELSTGYSSIFKAIIALASNAEVVMYDEPVLGLDANHRELFYRELIANYSANPKTIIVSTHLIEEVADVLEEAIIIKEGRIILKEAVEDLLTRAYTVSGEASKVETFAAGKTCAGAQTMGLFESVTILEKLQDSDAGMARELGLDIGKVELQKLFISLTNS